MREKESGISKNTARLLRLFKWLIVFILLVVLYGSALVKWGSDIWTDPNYSHGLLIPLVSLYILKQRFGQIRQTQPIPSNKGLLFILPALVLFILASVAGELFSQRVSFVILIYGLVFFLEGKAIARLFLILDSIVRHRSDGALVRVIGPWDATGNFEKNRNNLLQAYFPF
jgi:hypothetical protein